MTKVDAIKYLMDHEHASSLLALLRGTSRHCSSKLDKDLPGPPIELSKLVGVVRSHLYFVSNYGSRKTYVLDGECHHFSYQRTFDEWMLLDAPGVTEAEVLKLYEEVSFKRL